jgi:hypothetical protein
MDGYVKLYRSVREDGWFQSLTDRQKLAWIYLLLEVNWQPSEFGCSRCGEVFNLPAGSTAKSLSTLSNRMGCTIKVLRGLFKKGIKKGAIRAQRRAQCHCVYVIENWHKYQSDDDGRAQQRAQRGHREGTERALEEEGKKERSSTAPAKKPSRKAAQELPKKGKPYTERAFKTIPDFALCCYYEEYQQRHGQPPQVDWQGRDRVVMSKLCSGPPSRDRDQIQTLVCSYLDCKEDYLVDAGHPIALLPYRVNALQGHQKPKRRMPDVLQPVDWKAIREGKQ